MLGWMVEEKAIDPHIPVLDRTERNRLRLRGLRGVTDEFTLGGIAQNLRRMAKLIGCEPPIPGIGAPV